MRSSRLGCNLYNPNKFTYKPHKPTGQSNKLHQLSTIDTLLFFFNTEDAENENVFFFLICELENENVKT